MNIKKVIKFCLLLIVLTSSINIVYAQTTIDDNGAGGTTIFDSGDNGSNFSRLQNPLEGGGVNDIPTLVRKLLDIVLTIAVPIIAVAIIYTGFLFISAQGNPEALKKAKTTLMYVLIGAAILLAAYVIAEAIESTVRAITG